GPMSRTPNRIGLVLSSAICVGVAALALAQAPPGTSEPVTYQLEDFGTIPHPAVPQALLRMPAVVAELKLTEGQQKAHDAIMEGQSQRIKKARRDAAQPGKIQKARRDAAAVAKFQAALREELQRTGAQEQGQEPTRQRPVEKIEQAHP